MCSSTGHYVCAGVDGGVYTLAMVLTLAHWLLVEYLDVRVAVPRSFDVLVAIY